MQLRELGKQINIDDAIASIRQLAQRDAQAEAREAALSKALFDVKEKAAADLAKLNEYRWAARLPKEEKAEDQGREAVYDQLRVQQEIINFLSAKNERLSKERMDADQALVMAKANIQALLGLLDSKKAENMFSEGK